MHVSLPDEAGGVGLGMRGGGRRSLQLERHVVRVAVVPVLARLERPDDGMARPAVVPGRVLARRVVAAPDVPAFLAHPQVDPVVPAGGQSFDAARARRPHVLYMVEVAAGVAHTERPGSQPINAAAAVYVLPRNSCTARRGSAAERTASYGSRNSPTVSLHAASARWQGARPRPSGAG